MVDGFLGRWSQRKTAARAALAPAPQAEPATAPPPTTGQQPAAPRTAPDASAAQQAPAAATVPTLEDVAQLTAESDFSPFAARAVAPQVRNAAMKKLFADPHFNRMDGLDTYIGDYSVPDPLPLAMLRRMASARFMQLADDPLHAQPPGVAGAGQTVEPLAIDTAAAAAAGAGGADADPSIAAVPPDAGSEPPCA